MHKNLNLVQHDTHGSSKNNNCNDHETRISQARGKTPELITNEKPTKVQGPCLDHLSILDFVITLKNTALSIKTTHAHTNNPHKERYETLQNSTGVVQSDYG